MESRKFEITGSGVSIVAFEGATDNTGVLLTNLSGWDESNHVEISTTPKLFGSGSYVKSKALNERAISASIFLGGETAPAHAAGAGLRGGKFLSIQNAADAFTEITLKRKWLRTDGTVYRTETLKAFITGIPSFVVHGDGSMEIEIEFLCPNPIKAITL